MFGGSLALYLCCLPSDITWGHWGGDGAELTLAAVSLGVPHPSGSPAYVFLAKLFTFFPWGTLSWKTHLFSAVSGALANAGLTVLLLGFLTIQGLKVPRWIPIILGLTSGLASTPWSQAIITELYAPQCAFLVWSIVLFHSPGSRSLSRGFALWAVAVAIHPSRIVLFPGVIGILWPQFPGLLSKRCFWRGLLLFGGLIVLLYGSLTILSYGQPPVNWSDIQSSKDWLDHITGSQYRFHLQSSSVVSFFFQLGNFFIPLLGTQWSFPSHLILIVCCFTLFWSIFPSHDPIARRSRQLALLVCFLTFPFIAFGLQYQVRDAEVYFLFPIRVLTLLAAFPLFLFFRSPDSVPLPLHKTWLAMIPVLALFVGGISQFPLLTLSKDTSARDFVKQVFKTVPKGSFIIADSDGSANGLALTQFEQPTNPPQITPIRRALLPTQWYRRWLRKSAPGLLIPEPIHPELFPDWESLAGELCRKIVEANPERSLYQTQIPDFPSHSGFYEQSGPVWKLRTTPPIPDSALFGQRFAAISLEPLANADYRSDPMVPGTRNHDRPGYPDFHPGTHLGANGTPWFLPAFKAQTGTNTILSLFLPIRENSHLPLQVTPTVFLHLILGGGRTTAEKNPSPDIIRLRFGNGETRDFPFNERDELSRNPFPEVAMTSLPVPKGLVPTSIAFIPGNPPDRAGIILLAITQEFYPQ